MTEQKPYRPAQRFATSTQRSAHLLCTLLVLGIAMLACNAPSNSPTPDLALVVAQTQTAVALEHTLTAIAATSAAPTNLPTDLPTGAAPTTQEAIAPTESPPSPALATPGSTVGMTPPANCTNQAKFETETIPDDSVFQPNTSFVKTWTLRNIGTCTWTPDYSLVFTGGNQMGAAVSIPLGQSVPPNGIFVATVTLVAPAQGGNYQGFWKLRSPGGQEFGLGKNADVAFWVKITVSTGGSGTASNQGEPDWIDRFNGPGASFYLGADSDIGFALKDGELLMTAFRAAGDQWRIAQKGYLGNAYLEAQFETGESCAGKDSYGLIIRAPDQPSGIINSGYIITFSCDGKYRLYRMDNGAFTSLKNWTGSSAILTGPKQKNVMGILTKDNQIQVFANGTLVYEISDSTYSVGYFGLVIRSESTTNLVIAVDQIAYWLP